MLPVVRNRPKLNKPSGLNRRLRKRADCNLQAPGWNPTARAWLKDIITEGAGQGLPVVLDFDNTIICGDVSEATLAVLAKSGMLKGAGLPATLCPAFRPLGKARITLGSCADLTEYYEAFLSPSVHGKSDPSPLANGYVWAVEVMEGLSPLDVVEATHTAFQSSNPTRPTFIEVTPGKTAFPVPFFYAEMIELVAELLRHQFDIWIVSAGNVWSIRWMISRVLNQSLRRFGTKEGVRADHIIGVSTLLADRRDRLFKDTLLVREHPEYAALEPRALRALKLTSRLQFPVPMYSGKVACILDALGRRPFLCVGDSPSDHPMMAMSENWLWIARLEKPFFQEALAAFVSKDGHPNWMVQAALTRGAPGFVPELKSMSQQLASVSSEVRRSVAILARLGMKSGGN